MSTPAIAVVIDCHDPVTLAAFWSQLLEVEIDHATATDDWVALRSVPGLGYLGFQRVPESKQVKNRVHVDVLVDDIDRAVQAAIQIGATTSGGLVEESASVFQVMIDPDGNEFCFVVDAP
jgi:predicted enzyme related to lactoylglutathione lyase